MPTAPLAGVLGFNSAVSSPCHPLWFTYRSLWRTHNHSRWLGPRFVLCAKRRPDPGTWTRKRAFTFWHHSFINFGLDIRHISGAPIHREWKWSEGIWDNPEEQTAFLYRLWAQNYLSKNRATTRRAPFWHTSRRKPEFGLHLLREEQQDRPEGRTFITLVVCHKKAQNDRLSCTNRLNVGYNEGLTWDSDFNLCIS